MPHHMEIVKIFDERIGDNENIVVKDKIKLKCLGINQKPNKNEARPSQ